MRGAAHLLATLVLVPYLALALGFVLLGQAISGGTLLSFFLALVAQAAWLIPWGFLAIFAALAGVAALGLSARLRWLGGVCVALLATGSILTLVVLPGSPLGVGEIAFLLPCLAAAAFGTWLAVAEAPKGTRRS
jgi:hypothetical protein